MTQIDLLNKLNMLSPEDPNYQSPPDPKPTGPVTWDSTLKVLETYNSPQAKKLAKYFRSRYNLNKVEQLNRKENNMEETNTPTVETPATETPVETPETTTESTVA